MKTSILLMSLLSSTAMAGEISRVELITHPDKKEEPKIVQVHCPEAKPQIIRETKTEKVVEKTPASKNSLKFYGGIKASDFKSISKEEIKEEESGKSITVNLPEEDNLLYGVGYDRIFGVLSIGAGYMRNRPKTEEIYTINFGLNW